MNNSDERAISINFRKDKLTLRSWGDIFLPEISHHSPQHKLALFRLSTGQLMTASAGTTMDYVKFTCPWCNFCLELDWIPGMPFERIAEQVRKTVSSQSHD